MGGAAVMVSGMGLSASGAVFCGVGASTSSEAWSVSAGTVVSSTSVRCVVPARGAGMRVVEVAMSQNGEMSRGGAQIEYAAVGSVSSVMPSSGVVAGGTMVTVAGSGITTLCVVCLNSIALENRSARSYVSCH